MLCEQIAGYERAAMAENGRSRETGQGSRGGIVWARARGRLLGVRLEERRQIFGARNSHPGRASWSSSDRIRVQRPESRFPAQDAPLLRAAGRPRLPIRSQL